MFAAAENSNPEVVQTLLNAGADPSAQNNSGETAWDYIEDNEDLQGTDVYWELNELRFE